MHFLTLSVLALAFGVVALVLTLALKVMAKVKALGVVALLTLLVSLPLYSPIMTSEPTLPSTMKKSIEVVEIFHCSFFSDLALSIARQFDENLLTGDFWANG